ncbi:MAG: hypothetical protein WAW75_06320 [Gallionella sp.]
MNEEQAVLDFFAQEENLPLGLAVADQVDTLREQMNNRLWRELQQRLVASFSSHGLDWQVELTEDKNASECLVGLHCNAKLEQDIYLRPMLEQQYLGGEWRIYFGLMWSTAPTLDQLGLAAVSGLKESLQQAGYKNNTNFLAWQWTAFHPRRRDFLLRYANEPEMILGELGATLTKLLVEHGASIAQANSTLSSTPRSTAISLDHLRSKRSNE